MPKVTVPNFDVIGWHDHCNGDVLLHRTMIEQAATEVARTGSHTVIGPWSHTGRGGTRVGQIQFGQRARYDIRAATLRWFDHWLKGKLNAVRNLPPFRIFVMGDNRWRNEQEWPPKRAVTKMLFLTSSGGANTPTGDGRLEAENPGQAGQDVFTYDPADPVPTLYGKGAFTVPADQAPLAQRQDILVFQTEPLKRAPRSHRKRGSRLPRRHDRGRHGLFRALDRRRAGRNGG